MKTINQSRAGPAPPKDQVVNILSLKRNPNGAEHGTQSEASVRIDE